MTPLNAETASTMLSTDARKLWWDADGAGAAASVVIASLSGTVGFGASELIVIA